MTNNTERLLASGTLQCPACSGSINPGNTLSCSSCGQSYPLLGDIPVLVPEPEKMVGLMQNRLGNFINGQQRNIHANNQRIASPSVYAPLRERLKNITRARNENLQAIIKLMEPLRQLAPGVQPAAHADSPGFFTTMVYLLRDWAWGAAEVDILCNKVISLLPENFSMESLLVLGAGGCRASLDLHNHYKCPLTVSVDISPLMLLGASRVVAGDALGLHQILPNNIRNAADNVTYWDLHAPEKPAGDFLFMLADANNAPFAEHAFQTVLTPFIIDEIGEDLRSFAPRVNRLIKPGGYWLNYGAMTFLPGFSYTAEEVISIVSDSGFRVLEHGFSTQPHAAPRESCQRQVYDCLYFCAIKE